MGQQAQENSHRAIQATQTVRQKNMILKMKDIIFKKIFF